MMQVRLQFKEGALYMKTVRGKAVQMFAMDLSGRELKLYVEPLPLVAQ